MAKGQKTGGRQKGTPNKITADLKTMILGALEDEGGQAYLQRQARENPTAFMSLLGKVLPTTLANDKEDPIQMPTRIELVAVGVDGTRAPLNLGHNRNEKN